MKIKKLNEKASDIQNKEMKLYGGEKGKPANPYEAFRAAKNIKEMDDSVAWALNEATDGTDIGDKLQSNLPAGTLLEFINAFKWEELVNKDNLFIYLLKKLGATGKINELKNPDDFRSVYNGYVNDIYTKDSIEELYNKNKGDWFSELISKCNSNPDTHKSKKQNIDANKVAKSLESNGDKDKAKWVRDNKDNLEAVIDVINNQ